MKPINVSLPLQQLGNWWEFDSHVKRLPCCSTSITCKMLKSMHCIDSKVLCVSFQVPLECPQEPGAENASPTPRWLRTPQGPGLPDHQIKAGISYDVVAKFISTAC